MDFFEPLLQFALKAFVVLIVFLLALAGLASQKKRQKEGKKTLSIQSLNEQFNRYQHTVLAETDKKRAKAQAKSSKKQKKKQQTLFVLDFKGDINANAVNHFRDLVSTVLLTADKKKDEVLIRLESGGGAVHQYGLAAAQCQRLSKAGIRFTVAIDRVAASGGYMMACTADHIIAAPFAIVGSIGVVFQLPNINKLLHKNHIEIEQLTAGDEKRNLTLLGKNTDADRAFCQQQIEEVHSLFRDHIAQHRADIDIAHVSSGRYWYATQALSLKLIDTLETSDSWLLEKMQTFSCQHLSFLSKRSLAQKCMHQATGLVRSLREVCEQLFQHKSF